jgi:FlaA1/EpsC-like NDP-sugar epimerase
MVRSWIGQRLAALRPRAKLAVMIGGDAVFLPLCLLAAVSLRLGSIEAAFETAPWIQLALGLSTLPVLGYAGLYRTVVRYIDLRVIAASGLSLAVAVLAMYGIAYFIDVRIIPRSSLLIYWFIAFTYVITSRFIARALLRQGLHRSGRPRVRTAIYGAGDASSTRPSASSTTAPSSTTRPSPASRCIRPQRSTRPCTATTSPRSCSPSPRRARPRSAG